MSELTEFRQEKDHFFAHDHHSPLTEVQRVGFGGLSYYDENPGLRFELDLEPFEDPEIIEMQTSTGDVTTYERLARIDFEVDSQVAQLTVFKDPDEGHLFLPFVDTTSGGETHGAGRYLEVEPLTDGRLLVDFNYAYNPNCAYDDAWSCPLTPFENRLQVPIRAGEKNLK